jgi:alpha-1,3-fucosyltransferase
MAADIVPIVYGGADYSPYAPPSSYIDAGDFKSPKACNTAAGREWRPLFEIFLLENFEKCNDPQQKPKVYADMTDWWYHKDVTRLSGLDCLDSLLQKKLTTSWI